MSNTKPCPTPFPSSIIIPPSSGLADPEFNKINLSVTARLVVLIYVKSPLTDKLPATVAFPDKVNPTNVGESVVCKPKSTSVLTPLIPDLIVPCEGALKFDPETTPASNSKETLFADTVDLIPLPPSKVNVSPPATTSVVPASAATEKEVAIVLEVTPVIRPCASTVIPGTTVVLPYVPAVTAVFANLAAVTASSAILASITAPSAIVSAPFPVTSPV